MTTFILATAGYDAVIRLFNAVDDTLVHNIMFSDPHVLRLAFSAPLPALKDPPLFLVAGGSPSVAVYDVSSPHVSPTLFHVYQGHSEAITAVGFEPLNTAFVFSASEDGTLQTWIPTLTPSPHPSAGAHRPVYYHRSAANPLAPNAPRFSGVPATLLNYKPDRDSPVAIHDAVYYPPSDLFFTADALGRLRVWRHRSCENDPMATVIPHRSRRNLQCLDISASYDVLVTANFDGVVFVFRVQQLLTPQAAAQAVPHMFSAHSGYVPRVKMSASASILACTTCAGITRVFRMQDILAAERDVLDGSPGSQLTQRRGDGREASPVTTLAQVSRGKRKDGFPTLQPLHELCGRRKWVWDASFVENRDDFLFTCSSISHTLWSLDDVRNSTEYAGHERDVLTLAVCQYMGSGYAVKTHLPS